MFRYLAIFLLVFIAGCTTVSYVPDTGRGGLCGFYHEVSRGQTLWGISKIYDVDLKAIIKANRLPDASKIEVGQLIFVPGAPGKSKKVDYAKNGKFENFMWPLKGAVVSYFGSTNNLVKNKGIDIQAREGASVLAARSGKVSFVTDQLEGYGKTIIIDHLDGFETVYAHNAKNFVANGQMIKKGEVIAKAGKTGRAKNPTLHFEIRRNHKPQNPFYYLP